MFEEGRRVGWGGRKKDMKGKKTSGNGREEGKHTRGECIEKGKRVMETRKGRKGEKGKKVHKVSSEMGKKVRNG